MVALMMMIDIYICLQKLPKIDLKTLKIAISRYVCLVAETKPSSIYIEIEYYMYNNKLYDAFNKN